MKTKEKWKTGGGSPETWKGRNASLTSWSAVPGVSLMVRRSPTQVGKLACAPKIMKINMTVT